MPYHFYSKNGKKPAQKEILTPVEMYKRLLSETFGNYTQDPAVKLKLNYAFLSFHSFWS